MNSFQLSDSTTKTACAAGATVASAVLLCALLWLFGSVALPGATNEQLAHSRTTIQLAAATQAPARLAATASSVR